MKYKLLSKEQIIISFDRLMRFKPTKDKYFRVFSDIIYSNLIEPVYRKQDLINMPADEITKIAEEIINESLKHCTSSQKLPNNEQEDDCTFDEQTLPPTTERDSVGCNPINGIINHYENSVYINTEETQGYLNNNINYSLLIPLIDETCPINLRWLKSLYNKILRLPPENNTSPVPEQVSLTGDNINSGRKISYAFNNMVYDILINIRHNEALKHPIQKVLLVEGITEEILLPAFSKYLGFDFYKEGIHIIAAGGKNQVVKMYYELIEELKIPIFLLLDKDAAENIRQIKPKLRVYDKIHLVSCGEFEDLLPKSLMIKTLNNELNNFASITEEDFDASIPNAKNLENIFKAKGLHEFKKADFAKMVRENISDNSDISAEIASIILEIRESKAYLHL